MGRPGNIQKEDQNSCLSFSHFFLLNPKTKIEIKVRASVCLEETIQLQRPRRQQVYSVPVPIQS